MSTASLERQPATVYSGAPSEESLYSNGDTASAAAHIRPTTTRRETDHILSYYQSEFAGRSYESPDAHDDLLPPSLVRKVSSSSRSSSVYSSDVRDSDVNEPARSEQRVEPSKPIVETRHTRRPSAPSEGGADRRRLAIVELDATLQSSKQSQRGQDARMEGTGQAQPSLLSRRGVRVDDLALVAPPDASPTSYTNLTPPTSAPITADRPVPSVPSTLHQRSISEAVHSAGKTGLHRKPSRDIGIIGIAVSASESSTSSTSTSDEFRSFSDSKGLRPPVFQTPGRSPATTPGATTPELSDSGECLSSSAPITTLSHDGSEARLTPAIGEAKDIQRPVVGPVVVGLTSGMMHRQPVRATTSSSNADTIQARPTPSPNYFAPHAPSPYLHYEPGKHSTAGPLPPPPVISIDTHASRPAPSAPPPRPPRLFTPVSTSHNHDIAALKQALQLPKAVSAALASRPLDSTTLPRSDSLPKVPKKDDSLTAGSTSRPSRSIHTREGAFPPSTILTESPVIIEISDSEASDTGPSNAKPGPKDDDESPVVVDHPNLVSLKGHRPTSSASSVSSAYTLQEPTRRSALDLRRESSWVSLGSKDAVARAISPNGGIESSSTSPSSLSAMRSPPVPPKSRKSSEDERSSGSSTSAFKATLTNLKRFSALPRTPSFTSSGPSPKPSRSPSPVPAPLLKPSRPRPKFRSQWPDAMHFNDVLAKKSTLERSVGYAEKINELALYDCGLEDWVMSVKHRGSNSKSTHAALRVAITPPTPSVRTHAYQPRHTSHGSLGSEVTFPTRSDAYTATDLSVRYSDVEKSSNPLPVLPYPSLAQAARSLPMRSSTVIGSPSRPLNLALPGSKSHAPGFFSSIGRKASVKRDKYTLPPPVQSRVLTKRPPSIAPQPIPKPVQITSTPSVPGGPRAAPNRIQRSQTFSVSPTPPAPEPMPPKPTPPQRQSTAGRRPSLFARARGVPSGSASNSATGSAQPAAPPTPEFQQQVDKLADLLPQADRTILAGYLRRAGQDILAIGQYLEDEKNGTLRRD